MTSPLIQTDIETEILRLSALLEETTEEFGKATQVARGAEATYRVEYAKAFVRCRMTDKLAEETSRQRATELCGDLLAQRMSAEGLERYLEERCRSIRAQLDAVRTLSANVRSQGG